MHLMTDEVGLDFRLKDVEAFSTILAWRRIQHPNIISVREAFTTSAFGDACKSLSQFPTLLAQSGTYSFSRRVRLSSKFNYSLRSTCEV